LLNGAKYKEWMKVQTFWQRKLFEKLLIIPETEGNENWLLYLMKQKLVFKGYDLEIPFCT
jgi:hypothetical protein